MDLRAKKCVPCEGGVPKLTRGEAEQLLEQVPEWHLSDDRVVRAFRFADFVAAMRFVNRMAEIAEAEGHHPDFSVHYNHVEVSIWTHAIGGLSQNDFILAAKLNDLV